MLNMTKQQVVNITAKYVRKLLDGEGTGHDWWHVKRVWDTAKLIGKKESADLFVVELAALLHDVADHKFTNDEYSGARHTETWLKKLKLDNSTISKVKYIVQNISYKGGANRHKMQTMEGKVVQDADRLDALGAIGIARTFSYNGKKDRPIHDPRIKPKIYKTFKSMQNTRHKHTAINHFYEKLLLVRSRLNTKTAKLLAKKRDKFMRDYLKQFYKEWEGKF